MGLRCFLFSSDQGTIASIGQILKGLDIEAESCSEAVTAVDKIANSVFQIVIVDWDKQAEAALLLSAARERKASERPVTLAIVSDDLSFPRALQAGANSVLRRPIVVSQARDTLRTARDLLRSKRDVSSPAASKTPVAAAVAGSKSTIPASMETGKERTLRAGEFLHAGSMSPGGSFETESDVLGAQHQPAPEPVDPLKDLEPVAASVMSERASAIPPQPGDEPRGLEWYLKARGIARQGPAAQAAAPAPAPSNTKPELLGWEQASSSNAEKPTFGNTLADQLKPQKSMVQEQQKEAELFAYIDGNGQNLEEPSQRRLRLGKGPIIGALLLAALAIAAAPQAPWHSRIRTVWLRGQKSLHAWLNPQPLTPAQAPPSHENFARAGDEYKLPVAETIPDATTDPSQIQVVPVIDPTAKKPPSDGANPGQPSVQPETNNDPFDPPKDLGTQGVETQAPPTATISSTATTQRSVPPSVSHDEVPSASTQQHGETAQPPVPAISTQIPKIQHTQIPAPNNIPSSLKSQMATSTPEASGNKPVEAALPSIEPIVVAEGVERSLLLEQAALSYPGNAKGQTGTVILQVLIGRDGTVQDAKFLQGSLAFARTAIEGVKLWKFKPYLMNGRPASVQTLLTIHFKPSP